jgi:hypothetical protein
MKWRIMRRIFYGWGILIAWALSWTVLDVSADVSGWQILISGVLMIFMFFMYREITEPNFYIVRWDKSKIGEDKTGITIIPAETCSMAVKKFRQEYPAAMIVEIYPPENPE